ncbi:MAG TPA: hypothetical protein VGB38_01145 [bacterium]
MKKQFIIHSGRIIVALIPFLLGSWGGEAVSQTGGGYINYGQMAGSPLDITLPDIDFPQSPNWIHVSQVGMGKTQTADTRFGNGMLANPALLSDAKYRFDVVGLQVNFPKATFDAASFVKKNAGQFKKGDFLKLLGQGFSDYYGAETLEQQAAAVQKINSALGFPNELLSKIVGDPQNPQTQGLTVIPSVQIQYGNWGFSLFGRGQIGFVVNPGETTSRLLGLHIPENTADLSADVLKNLAEIVGSLFDENGNVSQDALPQAFAMSSIDVVGAVGRSYRLGPNLDAGANLKIINRRFSTKLINADNLDRVLSEARSELKTTATGVTLDLGLLYHSPVHGIRVGFSLLNALPVKTIASTTTFQFVVPTNAYYVDDGSGLPAVGSVDPAGNFYPDPAGDTLLVVEKTDVTVKQPFRLKAPLLANVGVSYPVRPNWDVMLDWVDMFSKDNTFNGFADRIRIGTEYRFTKVKLNPSLRAGITEKHLALGAGIRTKFVQFDLALARDPFLERNALFGEVQMGW